MRPLLAATMSGAVLLQPAAASAGSMFDSIARDVARRAANQAVNKAMSGDLLKRAPRSTEPAPAAAPARRGASTSQTQEASPWGPSDAGSGGPPDFGSARGEPAPTAPTDSSPGPSLNGGG
jgi:hypothetical protein